MPEKKQSQVMPSVEDDPAECPFREFRDTELSVDFWGMGPAQQRRTIITKLIVKPPPDYLWVDEQTQPLPRSVRQYLHGWVRAEELAASRWDKAATVIFEETGVDKMSIIDMQLSHTQVLLRSSFCRKVLSACYILEQLEPFTVEHQWENFTMTHPEGWRPRYHIYSPGLKPGGGPQHRPSLSKNGCYLVRLYYLGAWRCVWVSDQVPVDATGAPLLPFTPLASPAPTKPAPGKQPPVVATVTSSVVHLWPLLLCKALLKLTPPDMNNDEESDSVEDEEMPEFKILHTLTGAMEVDFWPAGQEDLWRELLAEVQPFMWEGEDDEGAAKSKAVKKDKPTKEANTLKRSSFVVVTIRDTKDLQSYTLPGLSPCHEMPVFVSLLRDVPLKKPIAEPDVALWKKYRWVDWARGHGLYDAYAFPRTRYLKMTGFMKLSYAPHLLDVQSTETITVEFRKAHGTSVTHATNVEKDKKSVKDSGPAIPDLHKEELREWILYDNISALVKRLTISFFPSMYNFTTVGSDPPLKITKVPMSRALDMVAHKSNPLYLQIDGPESNHLKISLHVIHPRIFLNCGVPLLDYVEPAYLILEVFEWFKDTELPKAKAYVRTRGYDTVQVHFLPGRHYCRLWVHSPTNWHVALLSESSLLVGPQDLIQGASVYECPWAVQFLSNLGTAFANLLRHPIKSSMAITIDTDFYKAYQPDLIWNEEVVGYKKKQLHLMFRSALQSLLTKRLSTVEFREVSYVLRRYLLAPEFGLPEIQPNLKNYRKITTLDPCDCTIQEPEGIEESVQSEEIQGCEESHDSISASVLDQLLTTPTPPIFSQVCELARSDRPCGKLKEEREKIIRRHDAATLLQAHWRGYMTRKCLTDKPFVTPEILKCLMESAFGPLEALSALMNEFFCLYPGAKSAYSVASALTGTTGIQNFAGMTAVGGNSKWVPYFQGVFYCHEYVKVNFSLQGTLQFNTIAVYDNDTGQQLPQVFRSATTFDFKPNGGGYMVMGHGTLPTPLGVYTEAHWQLTVLSSIKDVFHVCDSPLADYCREQALPTATKVHIDSLFIPNRRNILGGIKFLVVMDGAVSFRAVASSPDLDMVATLRIQLDDGTMEVAGTCAGKGELYWPYVKLSCEDFITPKTNSLFASRSSPLVNSANLPFTTKSRTNSASLRQKSGLKITQLIKDAKFTPTVQGRRYTIELTCPDGWPLTVDQWKRVEEVRNTHETIKLEPAVKKAAPASKTTSAKDKAPPPTPTRTQPQPGDAFAELEVSLAQGRGISAEEDLDRDIEFDRARRLWESREPGRNLRGAHIRKEFREEFLEVPTESAKSFGEEALYGEMHLDEEIRDYKRKKVQEVQVRPSPVTESEVLEASVEEEEEVKFLNLPEELKDKFIPLPFIPFCMKESLDEEKILLTPEMAEAAKAGRFLRLESAVSRMRELQEYNKLYVLDQHKERCNLLTKLFVESSWTPDLHQVLEARDEAIVQEATAQSEALKKKAQESKEKKKN